MVAGHEVVAFRKSHTVQILLRTPCMFPLNHHFHATSRGPEVVATILHAKMLHGYPRVQAGNFVHGAMPRRKFLGKVFPRTGDGTVTQFFPKVFPPGQFFDHGEQELHRMHEFIMEVRISRTPFCICLSGLHWHGEVKFQGFMPRPRLC